MGVARGIKLGRMRGAVAESGARIAVGLRLEE
jgi:hypothetical protein